MIEIPAPASFLEAVATALVAIAILFACAAALAGHTAVRMSAILLVVALSVFSNTWGTYFAAIFIVATAVTELGFLEKLAAIIRGSKEYFDYQKEVLTVQESKERAAREVVQAPGEVAPGVPVPLPAGRASDAGYAIEQLALSYIEKRLAASVQRNVRYRSATAVIEFDGVVQRDRGRPDVLVEVKLVPPSRFLAAVNLASREFITRKAVFEEVTGRRSTGRLVVVVPDKTAVSAEVAAAQSQIRETSHTVQLDVLDFSDIGYLPPGPA